LRGKSLTPAVAAARSLRELRQAGSAKRAAGMAGYFKSYERLTFFGVNSPTLRRMASTLVTRVAGSWTLDDARRYASLMITRPELEAKILGIIVLGRFHQEFDRRLLVDAARWLEKSCHDWASTDALCGEVIGPLLVSQPTLKTHLRRWRRSRALYVRRASAVGLIGLARRGRDLDEAYEAALALAADDHHLMHKAVGWLLRESGKADGARLERFLRRHGYRLSRTSVRYAIERFPLKKRRELLEVTRPDA
jgi:3-methyladenine DNA glycosylase AlkD